MPKISPLTFYIPKVPQKQIMHGVEEYSNEELKKLKKEQPEGFIHIINPDSKHHNKNTIIRERWLKAISKKTFLNQNAPSIYYYKMSSKSHTYKGLIGGVSTKDFEKGTISQHEKTYPKRAALMASYLEEVQIQAEPVVVIAETDPLESLTPKEIEKRRPLFSFTFDQTHHQIWKLIDNEIQQLQKWSEKQHYFHLADGHHRVASLSALSKRKNQDFLVSCFLIPQTTIQLHSFIWFLKDVLSGQKENELIGKIEAYQGELTSLEAGNSKSYDIVIKIKKNYFGIPGKVGLTPEFIREQLLDTFPEILDELCYLPDTGQHSFNDWVSEFDLVFYMKPCSKELLFDYAKKGKNLPAKSTYILPKLITGLFISPLESKGEFTRSFS